MHDDATSPTGAPHSPLVPRLRPFGTTIFTEMTELALAHRAANLGQGFPDHDPPRAVLDAAHAAMDAGRNQYAPGPGVPKLRAAIADHQARFHGLHLDADDEVTVTFGATEALSTTVLATCDRGDEVLLLDPSYDAYAAAVALAGATAVRVPALRPPTLTGADPAAPPRFELDVDRVAAAVTDRTRAMVVNTPHNPTGRVFDVPDLDALAQLCVAHDLLAITDEVYEHLLVGDATHVPLATRPGMRGRTVTLSSAGKTFSCTGWKVGWACAPPPLSAAVRAAKQFTSFSGGTPLQFGVAEGLRADDDAFASVRARNAAGHDRLRGALADAGVAVSATEGSYFTTVDVRDLAARGGPLADAPEAVRTDGAAFCRWTPQHLGVAAVPVAAFCADPAPVRPLIRLAVCKHDEVIDTGVARLLGR